MFDLWLNQAVHLSIGQALLLLALSLTLIGLVFIYYRMEGKGDV